MTMLLGEVESILQPYLKEPRQIVLALSGGIDSRVLLDVLIQLRHQTPFLLKAVHVHHGLSQNADDWAEQCKGWCEKHDVDFALERVTLDCDSGNSIESMARTARYEALEKHLQPQGILLTAQHNDDQVETFLLALKRGSGPKGLSAMALARPFQQGFLVRPLLKSRRFLIEQYAEEHGLTWVEDESNQDTRFDRNFIRHQVAPVLSQRWPHFPSAIQRSAELCAQQERLLDELLEERLNTSLAPDMSLSITSLNFMSEDVRYRVLRMWLSKFDVLMPSQVRLKLLWSDVAMARIDANPKFQFKEHEIRRYQQHLFCIPKMQDVGHWHRSLTINQPLELPSFLGKVTLFDTISTGKGLALSSMVLKGKLEITFRSEGLSAHPEGKVGHKTLKKWYQEFGVPSWQRRRTPILLCDEKVVAVADLYVDRQFCGGECEFIWE
ncbi:tRNA lysidine(34) synthetase TilS [Vibrio sp. RC27]